MALQKTDVFGIMRSDLERVESRVIEAATLDFPLASGLVLDIVKAGGKRLRPLMLLLAGRAYVSEDDSNLITAAAGVELLHTASLVHDDSVDRAALRRGKPTLNSRLGTGAVILVGDFLFAQSAILAANTGIPRVVHIFATTLGDMCDGQLREMLHAHQLDQSREQYDQRIYGKTASLFAGSTEMGGVIGGAPEDHVQALRGYGSDVGMAFQIVDDVLDLTQSAAEIGKPAGNDLRQGTITLPVMAYLERSGRGSDSYNTLRGVADGSVTDDATIDDLVSDIRSSGAIEESLAIAREFTDRAKARIEIVPDESTRDLLDEVADLAFQRVS
ncbi:MAG: polyprenyl synthetase family protein [Thermomicrobiales bacterium]